MTAENATEDKKSFETDLLALEKLVGAMESGEMGLEELVAAFEKGQLLVKSCNDRLNEVERRIDVIRKTAAGETATAPLPPLS